MWRWFGGLLLIVILSPFITETALLSWLHSALNYTVRTPLCGGAFLEMSLYHMFSHQSLFFPMASGRGRNSLKSSSVLNLFWENHRKYCDDLCSASPDILIPYHNPVLNTFFSSVQKFQTGLNSRVTTCKLASFSWRCRALTDHIVPTCMLMGLWKGWLCWEARVACGRKQLKLMTVLGLC